MGTGKVSLTTTYKRVPLSWTWVSGHLASLFPLSQKTEDLPPKHSEEVSHFLSLSGFHFFSFVTWKCWTRWFLRFLQSLKIFHIQLYLSFIFWRHFRTLPQCRAIVASVFSLYKAVIVDCGLLSDSKLRLWQSPEFVLKCVNKFLVSKKVKLKIALPTFLMNIRRWKLWLEHVQVVPGMKV